MIQRNQRLLNTINRMLDVMLLIVAYMASTYIRFDSMYGDAPALGSVWNPQYFLAAILYAFLLVFIYHFLHLYAPMRTTSFGRDVIRVIWGNFLGITFLTAFLYVTRITDFSRIAIALFAVFATVLILGKRLVVRTTLHYFRRKGYNLKHIILVGNGGLARGYVSSIENNPQYGYTLDGYVSKTTRDGLGKHVGTYEDLDSILQRPGIDEVVIALEPHEAQFMPMIINICERQGTRASIIPFFNDYTPHQLSVNLVGQSKLINIRSSPLDNTGYAILKRGMDIVGSIVALILTSPIMLFAATGIKITSPGPVIFKQERVGKGKKKFRMYKFRSMHVDQKGGGRWSKKDDPRKTRFGSFLRKTSIDELPQFFNVLKGDMSLVGPRPEIPNFVEKFRKTVPLYMIKHMVRPGITGWAQINGYRGNTSIRKRIKYDIWYIENWTLTLDIDILFRTLFGKMINDEKITKQ